MRGPGQSASGFTLIELMIVVAIVVVLAMIALPAYTEQIRKSRRADAITRIAQVQQAQERWRSNNATYGTLVQIGVPASVGGGHYTLSVADITAAGYRVVAQATGAQAGDTACVFLQSTLAAGTIATASGPTSAVGNPAAANSRCWNR
jgi:type IV pilus assembly protein PilE